MDLSLKLSENVDPNDILRDVIVRSYYKSYFLGYVNYWDQIVIRPASR